MMFIIAHTELYETKTYNISESNTSILYNFLILWLKR
jgi:hypothetical protein